MLFNTPLYAVFFAVVFAANWLLARTERPRFAVLLAASYVFYGVWDWRFLGLILFSTVLDWSVGLGLARVEATRARKALLGLSLAGNLGLLGFFKYYDFFAAELGALLAAAGLPVSDLTLSLVLPVGISFYTFQTLSYSIDVYRRAIPTERDLLRFALFVAFFPQLVAGPIVRASEFLPQLRRLPRLDLANLNRGLLLIAIGLAKKVLVADVVGVELVDPAFADPESFGGWKTLLAVWGYAFQIYGDFSGYSDVAIGSALLLGFDLGLNFNSPYRATTPSEFWRRWHISLSSWLRDYLYVPLGGNRSGARRTAINLMLTMLLGGLWHGASWLFVAWGGYHGLLLVLARGRVEREPEARWARALQRLVFFQLVCFGWVLFRARSLDQAGDVLASIAGPVGPATLSGFALLALALAALAHLPTRATKEALKERLAAVPAPVQGAAWALFVGLLVNAQRLEVPFIYFQF